ncbi:PEP-CTERM sorting domain-containing protein [Aquabacterium sp.]|jgi:PEP-CTERM motif|uniref:PEP-CTERM sorting domain-containing protein n=1 Tax=Aquabacterium sp. TaxID=1872578 RepID=UPI0025BA7C70|nr:PEP-CTERM sorting domain-containing protein [Aquabacterium sp.]
MHLSAIPTSVRLRRAALLGLGALFLHNGAQAAAGQWDSAALGQSGSGASSATPWISNLASGSAYAEWNVILGYPVDNTPDIAGSGTLSELTGGGFATSGGNIYGLGGPTSFQVDLGSATSGTSGTSGTWDVYLRVATQGSVALEAATLNGVSATREVTYNGVITGGFGGAEQESLWKWTLSGSGPWTFNFGATAAHMSLDQVAVYAVQSTGATPAVPEPETWALMAAGLGAIAVLRRRRPA